MKAKYYLGIDPGVDGSLSIIGPKKIWIYPFKNTGCELLDVLWYHREWSNKFKDMVATIEEPEVFGKKSNPKTLLVLGKNYGYLTGVLETIGIPYMSVSPHSWKSEYKLCGKPKEASIKKAHELFPGVNLHRTSMCPTEHDGMADSLLIAEYGRRHIPNETE